MNCTVEGKEVGTCLKRILLDGQRILPVRVLIAKKCCLGLAEKYIFKALAALKCTCTNKAHGIAKLYPLKLITAPECIGINLFYSAIRYNHLVNDIADIFKTAVCNLHNRIASHGFWNHYRKRIACRAVLCIP